MFDRGSEADDSEQVDAGSDRLVGGTGHGTDDGQPEGDPDALAGAVGAVSGALDAVGEIDLFTVEGRELMDVVKALEGVRRRVDALSAVALNRLDVTGVTESVRG
ncbi:MAG: hypothetical protein ACK5O2_14740, partial [Microthrixaceae bacterium]